MAIQTCGSCFGAKEVPTVDGWETVHVFKCSDCLAGDKAAAAIDAAAEAEAYADDTLFESLFRSRMRIQSEHAGMAMGTTAADRERATRSYNRLCDELFDRIAALRSDQREAFLAFHKARMAQLRASR